MIDKRIVNPPIQKFIQKSLKLDDEYSLDAINLLIPENDTYYH